MITSATKQSSPNTSAPAWHDGFLALLPGIRQYAELAFANLSAELREDLVQEVIASSMVMYVRLVERGRAELAYPTVLARYAVAQARCDRRVGSQQATGDVYSRHGRLKYGYRLQHLGSPIQQQGGWRETLVDDDRTPVPDQAAFRIDFPEWLDTLGSRDRQIAESLALGERTSDVARQFGVSWGRVSQLRRELALAWEQFHGEDQPDARANGTA